jgi:tetratricopeptide (TPR) repeat protein
VLNKEKDIDLESLYVYANENKLKWLEGPFSICIAEILLNIDDRHMLEAEDWVKKAIEADTRNRTMMYLGWDYALYAELLKRKGDLAGAKKKLGKAIEIYRECGADGWLKKAQQDLAELQKTG